MNKQWRRAALLLPALALVSAGGLKAQANGQVTGSADLGWRSFFERPSALEMAKFEEYRDMSPGPYLQNLQLDFLPGDKQLTSFELGGANVARRDESFFAKGSRPGLFDLRLGWDQIPHTYSTDGRNWGGSLTNFSLPVPRPDSIAWKSLSNAPYLDAIRNQWDVGRASLTLTPGERNDVKLEYTHISKKGERPMGMAFGSPGANQREILEPIDQSTNDLRLSESYAQRRYQVQLSYDLNTFHNADAYVSADNPLLGTSTATNGAATGRTALAPSNLAHTFSAAGGLNLPLRTRVNGALSYSMRLQNEPFIAMTDNAAITDAKQYTLPASLNGDDRTLMGNLTVSAHPARDVNVTARYRYWDFSQHTPGIDSTRMPIEIVNDRTVSAVTDLVNEAMPYRRQNGGVDLGFLPSNLLNLKAGIAWERWDRYNAPLGPRNVRTSNEYTPRLTLDLTPTSWALLRGSISRSQRRGTAYKEDMDRLDLRRFDEANRDAKNGDLLLQLTPNDQVNVDFNYGRGRDEFPADASNPLPLGVLSDGNSLVGTDVGWTPTPRLNLSASYTREVYDMRQRSRYGSSAQPNNLSYTWIGTERDWIETYSVGGNATLIRKKLDLEFRYDRSNGISSLHAMNPTTPTGGSANDNAAAVATDWPDISHSWNPIRVALRYQLSPNWSARLGYDFENFQNNDFRTNGIIPGTTYWGGRSTVDAAGDILLGNDLLPYRASYLTFTIGFRPALRKTELPVLSVAQ